VIAGRAPGQLQTVQSALARQRLLQLPLATEHPHQRIRAQLLVIVQVLIAQRQPVDALRQHLWQLVLDQQRHAPVLETARQTLHQVDLAFHFPQQQGPAVA